MTAALVELHQVIVVERGSDLEAQEVTLVVRVLDLLVRVPL